MEMIYHHEYTEGNFKQLVDRDYSALENLASEYKKKGAVTKISLYDSCQGVWLLTIEQKAA